MTTRTMGGRLFLLAGALGAMLAAPALAGGPRHFPRDRHRPRPAAESTFRLGLGLFTPDADSAFWDDTFSVFTGSPDSLEDVAIGADLLFPRSRWSAVLVSLEHQEGTARQAYRHDPDGFDVWHDTELQVTPLTVGLLFYPAGREGLVPYLGAGGGLYWWRYREAGDFLILSDPAKPIEFLAFESDGVTAGYYVLAGLDLPVGSGWSMFVEGRWQQADDALGGDFEGEGTIDLSGRSLRAGVAWRF
ncbi:MAG: hypothetical protein D6718_06330 [Acidobacteria bacterium]|nr:MAG: hypothetical protein D6718_06330 [Acidobacteriota bacterium]